jgi:cell division protein FtsI (penicillin-binding protein 3)
LICSFVATLPIENPRYVVLVVVDEPQGAHAYGSTVALPVAKSIIDGLLVIEKIPPSGSFKSVQEDTASS